MQAFSAFLGSGNKKNHLRRGDHTAYFDECPYLEPKAQGFRNGGCGVFKTHLDLQGKGIQSHKNQDIKRANTIVKGDPGPLHEQQLQTRTQEPP